MPIQTTNDRQRDDFDAADKIIVQSLAKLDCTALGVAMGAISGLAIFIATNFLVIKGGDIVGPNLALLSQFFIGYDVSLVGSFVGLLYGLVMGFAAGWLIAFLRNFFVTAYVHLLKLKGSMSAVNDYIDNP
jgi:hypothetical protein